MAGDAVDRVLGEEDRPVLDAAGVEHGAICGVEVLDVEARGAGRVAGDRRLGETLQHHLRAP